MRFIVDKDNKNKAYVLPELTEGEDPTEQEANPVGTKVVFKKDDQTFEEVYASVPKVDEITPMEKWLCDIKESDKLLTRNEETLVEVIGLDAIPEPLLDKYNEKKKIRNRRPE